ncbi:MAG: hypothetical protein RSC82_01550 [Oscillospiraceae bacterium]
MKDYLAALLEEQEEPAETFSIKSRQPIGKHPAPLLQSASSRAVPPGIAPLGQGEEVPSMEEQLRLATRKKAEVQRRAVPLPEHGHRPAGGEDSGTAPVQTVGANTRTLLFQLRRSRQQTQAAFSPGKGTSADLIPGVQWAAAEPVNWDALAEREARRYDGGFSLF